MKTFNEFRENTDPQLELELGKAIYGVLKTHSQLDDLDCSQFAKRYSQRITQHLNQVTSGTTGWDNI